MKKQKVLPAVRLCIKKVSNLTAMEYNRLLRVCYKPENGYMHENLKHSYELPKSKSSVVMVKRIDNDRILSWAMIDYDTPIKYGQARQRAMPEVCYWTQTRYRRMGLGRMVADGVKKLIGRHYDHYPEQNKNFFEAIGAALPTAEMRSGQYLPA